MGKRADSQKLKLCVLSKIKDQKRLLFGAFSKKLTKDDKVRAWKKINVYAQSIGVIPSNKDWSYLRDVWWPNVRKLATKKINNVNTTGSSGGRHKILTDVDNEIIDIIGKDSPAIIGLNVMESSVEEIILDEKPTVAESEVFIEPSISSATSRPPRSEEFVQTESIDKIDLEDKKRNLQIKLLEIQIYKSKLECRKLEIEQGLSPSLYTADILAERNMMVLNENACNSS